MRFNITIAPFKAQKPAYKRVFYFFLNVGYTKPIVEKILSMFFEKCKHHVAIFSKNHLSRHLPQLRFRVCFFLPALCYQFTNDVRIPLIPQAATLASLTPAALASFVLLPKKVIASTLSIKAPSC